MEKEDTTEEKDSYRGEVCDFLSCGVCICYFFPISVMILIIIVNLTHSIDTMERINVQGLMQVLEDWQNDFISDIFVIDDSQ